MEQAFLWLVSQFDEENIRSKEILYPTIEYFPFKYDGSKEPFIKTAEIIAKQMEIDFSVVRLDTYKENIHEIKGDLGHRIFTEVDKDDKGLSAGIFFDKDDQSKFDVFIEESNLAMPERLVATIAHEFAHIKLIGEKRLEDNDEYLTDLTTVVFGLGIFNANTAFVFKTNFDSWAYKSLGYLKQQEWGYALALYAYFRNERSPSWLKYLTPNLKADFLKSEKYIYANTNKIFLDDYTPLNESSSMETN
jgi:hypothetical protein